MDGFGALAQRQGAEAVIATMWPVADFSTSILMKEFYRLRETRPAMSKIEALRQAQLAMLSGRLKMGRAGELSRGLAVAGSTEELPFATNANAPFAHPYFWAPFVLIGNWK